jgi:hypothetical protein
MHLHFYLDFEPHDRHVGTGWIPLPTVNAMESTYARPGQSHPRCLLLGGMSRITGLSDKLSIKVLISCVATYRLASDAQ